MRKKILVLMIMIVTIFGFKSTVFAVCNEEESKQIQSRLDQIKITYEHIEGMLDSNNELVNGIFKVNITGLTEGLVLYNPEKDISIVGNAEGKFTKSGFIHGTYEFKLFPYDLECTTAYRAVKIDFPRYNSYSDSYLCNGIDSTKFLPCSKWYEYELDEKTFMARLKEYKDSEEKKKQNVIDITTENISNAFKDFGNNFVKFWYLYIIGLVATTLAIVFIIRYLNKNRKKNKKWK
ncbi:MAG: hypothetical protein MRZ37_02500 [Tenericutes bacterium]|nr:hypothetical protein [Mycoplasmatota bacterium]